MKRVLDEISIRALLAEGDTAGDGDIKYLIEFQSAPSLRRATMQRASPLNRSPISIRALLAEGDSKVEQ